MAARGSTGTTRRRPAAARNSVTVSPAPGDGKGGAGGGNGETGGVGPGKSKNQSNVQQKKNLKPPPPYKSNGTPTVGNPSTTFGLFGPAPVGVPNIVIDQFEIPPFLLPIYQACGTQYDIPWEVLASINKIETAFGTNLNVSSAGAMGWMQFIPSTWAAYGVDANGDGRKDPYNPVDAICAAARYLRAAGGNTDLRGDLLLQPRRLVRRRGPALRAQLRQDPVRPARLADRPHRGRALPGRRQRPLRRRHRRPPGDPRLKEGAQEYGNAADVITSSPTRRGINIFSRQGAPVVAVNDGVIKKIDHSRSSASTWSSRTPTATGSPTRSSARSSASTRCPRRRSSPPRTSRSSRRRPTPPRAARPRSATAPRAAKTDNPACPSRRAAADPQLARQPAQRHGAHKVPAFTTFKNYFRDILGLNRKDVNIEKLHEGSKVIGGTVLARVGGPLDGVAPHINFSIRPAGRGAPRIDPKPILDGWKLLEATAIYRAAGKNPFFPTSASGACC